MAPSDRPLPPEFNEEQVRHLVSAFMGMFGMMVGPRRIRTFLTDVVCNDAIWDTWEAQYEKQQELMLNVRDGFIDEFERGETD